MKANPPKKTLRTLPTLTEVVPAARPAAVQQSVTSGAALATAVAGMDETALVERVLQRLGPSMETQLQQMIAEALQEQMKELAPRIRQRLDAAVRKAAAQAVVAELKMTRSGTAGGG